MVAVEVIKAANTAKNIKKGMGRKKERKVRKSVHFRRPNTLKLPRKPKYPRRAIFADNKHGEFSLLKGVLTTEKAMMQIENDNTIAFVCDRRTTKHQIRAMLTKLGKFKFGKIRTLISPTGDKKAFVRLDASERALTVIDKMEALH